MVVLDAAVDSLKKCLLHFRVNETIHNGKFFYSAGDDLVVYLPYTRREGNHPETCRVVGSIAFVDESDDAVGPLLWWI